VRRSVGVGHAEREFAALAAPRPGGPSLVDANGELAELRVMWASVPVPPSRSLGEHLDGLRWLAAEVLARFR
jgi:hypothetical protein